jgi:hypothetical protein
MQAGNEQPKQGSASSDVQQFTNVHLSLAEDGEQLVFVSYSREQFYFAESLALALQRKGVGVWFDVQRLLAGTNWEKGLQRGLQSCSEFVLVASNAALASEHVNREWRSARAERKRILIALIEPTELPPELQDPAVSLVDCRADFEGGVEMLAASLKSKTVHRDVPLRSRRVPWDVALVAQSLLWSGLYAVGVAALCVAYLRVVGATLQGINSSNAIVLASMFGSILALAGGRTLMLRRNFGRHHFDTQELAYVGSMTPFLATLFGALFLGSDPFGIPTVPYVLLVTLGIAVVGVALYAAFWVLWRSGDLYRWAATGEADESVRRRHLKHAREPAPLEDWSSVTPGPYRLHYVTADRPVAEQVEQALSKPPVLTHDESFLRRFTDRWSAARGGSATLAGDGPPPRPWPDSPRRPPEEVQIAILSNKSSVAWVQQLLAQHERLVAIAASAITIPQDAPSIYRYQWVDLRGRSDKDLTTLGLFLRGAPLEHGYSTAVVPEALARPAWPKNLGVGAKLLQVGAGTVIAIVAVQFGTFLTSSDGFGKNEPLTFALVILSTLLQVWAVGVTLERRVGFGAVAAAMSASLILLVIATVIATGDVKQVILSGTLPLVFVAVARRRRWLPAGGPVHGPTLAIPAWSIWSTNLFWVAVPFLLICLPFALTAFFAP